MNNILVGSTECSFHQLVCILLCSSTGGIVAEKWTQLARQIGVDAEAVTNLEKTYLTETKHTSDVIHEILKNWRVQNGNAATLEKFVRHLEALGWTSTIDQIREEFCIKESIAPTVPLFKKTLPDKLPYYIPRKLLPRYELSEEIFTECTRDNIIVVAGIKHSQLSELTKGNILDGSRSQLNNDKITVSFIILDHVEDWQRLHQKTRHPIHLIFGNYKNTEYIWIDSKGSVSYLQKFITSATEELHELSFVTEIETKSIFLQVNQPVCISDTPGMGKSIFLMEVGRLLQNMVGNRIVIFIVISEWIEEVHKQIQMGLGTNLAILNSLVKFACDNDIAAEQLKCHFTNQNDLSTKLELLFDGFDEISSAQFQLAYNSLKYFLQFNKHTRIWVSTRPHLRAELENNMSVLAYNIVPFDTPHQIQFLESFWSFRHHKYQLSQERVSKFAHTCLEAIKCEMKSKDEDIAGVPLQCMLIAESYEEEVLEYSETGSEFCLHIQIKSIMDLYENLIIKKFAKYASQLVSSESEAYTDNETKLAHAYLALQLIFPHVPWVLKCCCKHEELVPLMHIFRIGIVEETTSEEPRFIHRTFAEYFIAWFITEMLDTEWNPELTRFLLSNVLENAHVEELATNNCRILTREFQYPVICYFMDCILQHHPNQIKLQIYFEPQIKSEILMKYAISACLHADSMFLFNFLHDVFPAMITYPEKYFDIKHYFTAILKCSLNFIIAFISIYKSVLPTHLTLYYGHDRKTKDLQVAVMRGNYSIFSYILALNINDLSKVVTCEPDFLVDVLCSCLGKSARYVHGKVDIKQRMEIMKTLLAAIPPEVQQLPFDKPIFDPSLPMLIELIKSRKFSFSSNWVQSILMNMCGPNITNEQYHAVLQSFPESNLVSVLNQGKGGLLYIIATLGCLNVESLILLKNYGLNFNARLSLGYTFLQACAKRPSTITTESGEIFEHKMLESAVSLGADYNAINEHGSVLHVAAIHCNMKALIFLITKMGMDVNIKDKGDRTPLDYVTVDYGGPCERYDVALFLKDQGGYLSGDSENLSIILKKAAEKCCPVTVRILTEIFNVDPNMCGDDGMTAFHHVFKMEASTSEDTDRFETVEYLLLKGAQINAKNSNGESPLMFALRYKPEHLSVSVYNLMRSSGATQIKDDLPNFIFWIATWKMNEEPAVINQHVAITNSTYVLCSNENIDPFKLSVLNELDKARYLKHVLSTLNFNVNAKSQNGDTLLHAALSGSRGCHSESVEILLNAGADINDVGAHGQTPLFRGWQSGTAGISSTLERKLKFLKFCFQERKDFKSEIQDINGYTLVHFIITQIKNCSSAEFQKFVEILIETNQIKMFHIPNNDKMTPLMTAVKVISDMSEETLLLLFQNGIDFSGHDARGYSVLHYLLEGECFHNLEPLLECGARCHCTSAPPATDRSEGAQVRKFPCVLHLEAATCVSEGSALPMFHEKMDGFACDLNGRDAEGRTPLHIICDDNYKEGFLDAVTDFVENGADLNLPDPRGNTVLHYAIKGYQSVQVLEELISLGADLKAVNNHKSTMLHLSASYGHPTALIYFLELNSIDINGTDGYGNTPLHGVVIDAKAHIFEMTQVLVEYGADISIVNSNGLTPLAAAIQRELNDDVLYLLK